jgi:hypothetical protein
MEGQEGFAIATEHRFASLSQQPTGVHIPLRKAESGRIRTV